MLAHPGQRSREETAVQGAGSPSRAARTGLGVGVGGGVDGGSQGPGFQPPVSGSVIEIEEMGGFEETQLTII